jgi:hypothetical protein
MKVVDIHDRDAFALAVRAVHEAPIVVQLPTVFMLLAAPTQHGAGQLDVSKARLAGKHYGTAIGSLALFLAQADASQLPPEFSAPAHFVPMTGSFVRVRFRGPDFDSATIRRGTHQGVLLDGIHRELFKCIEASFLHDRPDPLWGHHSYAAPLCTSCNVSGDPAGSIVTLDKALAFCRSRGVRLLVTCPPSATELGSYPIFGYERDRVRVHREGPGLDGFKQRIPARLRTW